MEMIDLYVAEVGQNLPARQRADLEAEIRSLIEDTVEGRSQAEGRPVDEALVVEVLKEFGSPAKMAASYMPPRYLIGPRFYPIFMLVMRIVLVVMGVVALVQLGVALTGPGMTVESALPILGDHLVRFMTSALAALGNVVFVFAILEWSLPKMVEKTSTWDPRSLKQSQSETDKPVRPIEVFAEMAFTVIALLIFNLYPQLIGFGYMENGQWTWYPVLSEAFFRVLPLMNIAWVLQIVLDVLLLRTGRWQTGTRWFKVGLDVLSLVILAALITGGPILDLPMEAWGVASAEAQNLENLANAGARILMMFILVMEGIDLVKLLIRLLYRKEEPVVIG